jgi:hypothetical protein
MTAARVHLAGCLLLLLLAWGGQAPMAVAAEAPAPPPSGDMAVMKGFIEAERTDAGDTLSDQRKHLILFILGAGLLACVIITAALGVSMAIYGKRVFVAHTIFAGFTVTLAITHAAIAIVWFFPF